MKDLKNCSYWQSMSTGFELFAGTIANFATAGFFGNFLLDVNKVYAGTNPSREMRMLVGLPTGTAVMGLYLLAKSLSWHQSVKKEKMNSCTQKTGYYVTELLNTVVGVIGNFATAGAGAFHADAAEYFFDKKIAEETKIAIGFGFGAFVLFLYLLHKTISWFDNSNEKAQLFSSKMDQQIHGFAESTDETQPLLGGKATPNLQQRVSSFFNVSSSVLGHYATSGFFGGYVSIALLGSDEMIAYTTGIGAGLLLMGIYLFSLYASYKAKAEQVQLHGSLVV